MRALLILLLSSLAAFAAAYGELPLAFEPNVGQSDPQVLFMTRGNGMAMFLTDREAVTVLGRGAATVRMKIEGGRAPGRVHGLDRLPGVTNYFLGNDPKAWRTNIPSYGKVVFEGVYPHIDLVYRGNQRRLEYDFVVAPGGDADAIELAYEGVSRVQVEPEGGLLLETAAGALRQARPLIYQETGGRRVAIAGGYKVQGRRVGFELARYDASRPLIIDPVLEYSTFLGGTGQDQGNAIAVDSKGCAYVTGFTTSANFPVQAPYKTRQAGQDVFVTKLRPDGGALMYSTYIGGSGDEAGAGIAVDSTGSVYIAGTTTSTNFPTQSPFQSAFRGVSDAFVVKLSPAGNTLVYATYIGGSASQEGHALALDAKGSAYITGWTNSPDYPRAVSHSELERRVGRLCDQAHAGRQGTGLFHLPGRQPDRPGQRHCRGRGRFRLCDGIHRIVRLPHPLALSDLPGADGRICGQAYTGRRRAALLHLPGRRRQRCGPRHRGGPGRLRLRNRLDELHQFPDPVALP